MTTKLTGADHQALELWYADKIAFRDLTPRARALIDAPTLAAALALTPAEAFETLSDADKSRCYGCLEMLDDGPALCDDCQKVIGAHDDLVNTLYMIANVLQAASSMGDPVGPSWLDKRIEFVRHAIKDWKG